MKIDEDKIDEAALALLWLARFKTSKHFDVWSSWKSIEWDVMNRLHDAGMISNPVGLSRGESARRSSFKSSSVWMRKKDKKSRSASTKPTKKTAHASRCLEVSRAPRYPLEDPNSARISIARPPLDKECCP